MKNVFVCIPLVEGNQVEIQPISYDTKREVVSLFEKLGKKLNCSKRDVSKTIQSIYSNRSSISIVDANNDNKADYIFYYKPEASENEIIQDIKKIIASACKSYTIEVR